MNREEMLNNNRDGYRKLENSAASGTRDMDQELCQLLQSRRAGGKIVLNIGGDKHEVMWRMLQKHPRSRLGMLALSNSADQVGSLGWNK